MFDCVTLPVRAMAPGYRSITDIDRVNGFFLSCFLQVLHRVQRAARVLAPRWTRTRHDLFSRAEPLENCKNHAPMLLAGLALFENVGFNAKVSERRQRVRTGADGLRETKE